MKTIQKTLILGAMMLTSSAFALESANRAWIARDSGERQCANTKPNLPAAVDELRSSGVQMLQVSLARLRDQIQCSACGCSRGNYFVAHVEVSQEMEELLEVGSWKVVSPLEIQDMGFEMQDEENLSQSAENDNSYQILPVLPEV